MDFFYMEIFGVLVMLVLTGALLLRGISESRKDLFLLMLMISHMFLLLADAVSIRINGIEEYIVMNQILTVFNYGLIQADAGFFNAYLLYSLSERNNIPLKMTWLGIPIGIGLTILWSSSNANGWFFTIDETGNYITGPYNYLCQIFGAVLLVFDALVILKYSKRLGLRDTLVWLSFEILPLVMLPASIVFATPLLYCSVVLSILLIYVMINEEGRQKMVRQELELREERSRIAMSQIRPHFIFNALTSIAQLCEKRPAQARETTIAFADYLRGNMNSLTSTAPVPFEEELKHTENYLYIENVRFGDALSVEYEIETENFLLPILTLQPIVENAVKHGVGQKEDGGTIRISTTEQKDHYQLKVEDDGVGFDVSVYEKRSDGHIGIANVKHRIENMLNGKMSITSTPGEGTLVTIQIPKEYGELLL